MVLNFLTISYWVNIESFQSKVLISLKLDNGMKNGNSILFIQRMHRMSTRM